MLICAKTDLFSISGMAFQDAWNLDLELLQDCCINIAASDGKLIPFCAYNLTNTEGQAIHADKSLHKMEITPLHDWIERKIEYKGRSFGRDSINDYQFDSLRENI